MSSGAETILSRASYKSLKTPKISGISRKLEMEFNKMLSSGERRRIKSSEHNNMTSSSSSAASSDVEDEMPIDKILHQSRKDLENTQALKIRRHLLHSDDFVSIH